MRREPFPRPGERLEDVPEPPSELAPPPRPARPISIFGGVGYGPGYPSRWAGRQLGATSRLTVEDDTIVIRPLAFFGTVLRLPTVRIRLDDVATANKSRGGLSLRFRVPGDPALDSTRFYAFPPDAAALGPLIELLRSRGITVETPPVSRRFALNLRDQAVGARPGWIFRDRGYFGFVEWFIILGVVIAGVVYFDSSTPRWFQVALVAVITLRAVSSLVGYRLRRSATRN